MSEEHANDDQSGDPRDPVPDPALLLDPGTEGLLTPLAQRTHPDTAIASLATSRAWRDGKLLETSPSAGVLPQAIADPDTLVWVDLFQPSVTDLQEVFGEIGLTQTAVEDVLGRHERPKIVQHEDWVYVTTHVLARRDSPDGPEGGHELVHCRISAIATHSALVTIRLDPGWDMTEVVSRWNEDPGLICRGVGALMHGLLDVVVDGEFEVLQALDDEAEDLEDVLLSGPTDNTFILQVYSLRKELSELRRVVVPMRDVVTGIQRHQTIAGTEMAPWWGDLYDHVLRATEWTESLRDMVSFLVETQMSLMDWRLNTVMKKLAGWAAIIAIPTLITGWFGQNVPFLGHDGPAGLWSSVTLIVVSTIALYGVFKKKDWL